MIDLNRLIEESDVFKEDYEFVKSVIEQVLEEVKTKKSQLNGEIELERLKLERVKAELKLAKLRSSANNSDTSLNGGETEASIDFDTLKEPIVSDKMFQTIDRETAAHINIRQSGDWFRPLQLGKECDLYFTSSVQNNEILPIIDKCSSFLKLQGVLAWCVRFKEKNPLQITTGNLTVAELSTALLCLVRKVQSVYFTTEIWCIERGQQLPDSINLLTLYPFLDERKILCVGGRLRHSNQPAEQKDPMLIPNNHLICDLIIKHYLICIQVLRLLWQT
ncbi:integrase catalytic domain-containing protein [Trichonephila clavata]|uniref:Integrase catalytic domain-containing protein n=1 Tax=Trichonephila clavata TaxID=2740835 RepID=A0A8X6M2M0_TRICU|nr:integrase catalytic domain-containing protein [Trichonephila clavata]